MFMEGLVHSQSWVLFFDKFFDITVDQSSFRFFHSFFIVTSFTCDRLWSGPCPFSSFLYYQFPFLSILSCTGIQVQVNAYYSLCLCTLSNDSTTIRLLLLFPKFSRSYTIINRTEGNNWSVSQFTLTMNNSKKQTTKGPLFCVIISILPGLSCNWNLTTIPTWSQNILDPTFNDSHYNAHHTLIWDEPWRCSCELLCYGLYE